MQVFFDYPWYVAVLCVAAGAAYSVALYWLHHKKADGNRRTTIALSVLRFATVTILALLLMGPVLKRKVSRDERPMVVVMRDVSQSVPSEQQVIPTGIKEMEKEYEVVYDSFGGGSTDIAAALQSVGNRYAGRNVGAVVLMSDGIVNRGANPEGAATALGVPVYTVALGDTTRRRDAWVSEVRCNRVAYAGSQFPMQVSLRADLLQGERATLSVTHEGRTVVSKPVTFTDNGFSQTLDITLDADRAGLQRYTVALSPSPGETSTANNSRTVVVEVLDGRRKVAIVAAAPHPDLGALKQAIESNPNYAVEVFASPLGASTPKGEQVKDWDMAILHNMPRDAEWLRWVQSLPATLPLVYIVGTQTDVARFNTLHCGMEITAKRSVTEEVTASGNDAFTLFAVDADIRRRIESLPPLAAPFGNYRTAPGVQPLFYAKIGGHASDRPLMAFGTQGDSRRAYIMGEGLWRWRLHSYLMTGSHDDFDQLIEKLVVFTSTSSRRDRLHVTAERIYRQDERVTLHAEFYDDNWQPTNQPEVGCDLTNTGTKATKHYDFQPSGTGYALPLGTLEPGNYLLHARTLFGGKEYTWNGTFAVEALDLERLNLVADHTLLNTISHTTGGRMLLPHQTDSLTALMRNRGDMKGVRYTNTQYSPLVSLPLVLVLIILLLALEWAGRKYLLNNE